MVSVFKRPQQCVYTSAHTCARVCEYVHARSYIGVCAEQTDVLIVLYVCVYKEVCLSTSKGVCAKIKKKKCVCVCVYECAVAVMRL